MKPFARINLSSAALRRGILVSSLALAAGHVSLEMPRIASDCHARFRHYFRATVTFKSGFSVASSYRIPLK